MIEYNAPNSGVQLQQAKGTIGTADWQTLFSSPFQLCQSKKLVIPLSFVLRVTNINNAGGGYDYFVGTSLQLANQDAFMSDLNFLVGFPSQANKDYTFYLWGQPVALGEISSNITPNYDIYLFGQIDDATIDIDDTPYVLTYFEIIF